MKDKSTMSLGAYLGNCLYYTAVSMIWYNSFLFRCLPGRTKAESQAVLCVLLGLSIFIAAFVINRPMKSSWTVVTALSVPFGLYTVLTYVKTVGNWMVIVLASAAALAVIFSVLIMTSNFNNFKNKGKATKYCLLNCCVVTQSIAAIALLVVMGIIGIQWIFGANILKPSIPATTGNQNSSRTINDNIDTILLLQKEAWQNLTTQEKLDVLQTVANIEAHYLGLPNELNVGASNLREYTLAHYNDMTYTITIDLDHLENDSVYDVLDSCCHEAYHGYQHRLVDAYRAANANSKTLLIYESAAQYEQEFVNYDDGYNDFDSYYTQECEIDAREYAKNAVSDYYERIYAYLNGTSITGSRQLSLTA